MSSSRDVVDRDAAGVFGFHGGNLPRTYSSISNPKMKKNKSEDDEVYYRERQDLGAKLKQITKKNTKNAKNRSGNQIKASQSMSHGASSSMREMKPRKKRVRKEGEEPYGDSALRTNLRGTNLSTSSLSSEVSALTASSAGSASLISGFDSEAESDYSGVDIDDYASVYSEPRLTKGNAYNVSNMQLNSGPDSALRSTASNAVKQSKKTTGSRAALSKKKKTMKGDSATHFHFEATEPGFDYEESKLSRMTHTSTTSMDTYDDDRVDLFDDTEQMAGTLEQLNVFSSREEATELLSSSFNHLMSGTLSRDDLEGSEENLSSGEISRNVRTEVTALQHNQQARKAQKINRKRLTGKALGKDKIPPASRTLGKDKTLLSSRALRRDKSHSASTKSSDRTLDRRKAKTSPENGRVTKFVEEKISEGMLPAKAEQLARQMQRTIKATKNKGKSSASRENHTLESLELEYENDFSPEMMRSSFERIATAGRRINKSKKKSMIGSLRRTRTRGVSGVSNATAGNKEDCVIS